MCAYVAATFGALEAGRALGDVGVNTMVLSRLPADALPILYIVLGAISLVLAIAFGAALGRLSKARLFAITLLAVGAVLVIERLAMAGGSTAILPIVWLTVTAAGTIGWTVGWTVAGATFNARQAKRLFPLVTAAAIAGNFLGGLSAGPVTSLVGAESLIVADALLLVVAAALIARLARRSTGAGWSATRSVRRPVMADVRMGFDSVRQSPLMRLVAVAYVLFAVLLFSVSFPYLQAVKAASGSEAAMAAVLGTVTAIITATSFIVSLVLANRFYARFGVAAAALLVPVVYLAAFGLWIVSFSFVTAVAAMVVLQVTQRGIANAAWSAFYNVVPADRRAQVLAFQDGVPGQVGTMLGGVLLLTAGRLLAPTDVFWLGLVTAAICTVVVVAIRRRYVESLLRTLRSGLGEQVLEGGPGLGDLVAAADVRATLVTALSAPEAPTRALAAGMLARSPAPDAIEALAGALDDPDAAVRGAAVRSLLGSGASGSVPGPNASAEAVLAALLVDGDPVARAAGVRALAALDRPLPQALGAGLLADRAPGVRAAAVEVLGATVDPDGAVDGRFIEALRDPAAEVRRAAAAALGRRSTVASAILADLSDGSPELQEAALLAMAGHGTEVREPVLAWAERTVARAVVLADAGQALRSARPASDAVGSVDRGDADIDRFLCDVLARRVERQQGLALDAMSVLGAPAARGVIRRSLRADDPDVRAQAIEALDSIGDRRLSGALTALIEHRPREGSTDRDEVVHSLRDDVDPWIRGLARRLHGTGGSMPEEAPPLAHLETMLRLRRVPLFERLEPEDLQRIAMVATERTFAPGEPLVREDEVGDELFVLVEGSVHVTRHEADGSERRIRGYGAGDHIGELAVLRERPRAATVTAGDDGVRALVIGGEGLTSILRERPDAAMAMLATLAERISVQ
ncbi:MAG TPA: HEAT repeat domain-containing protein [Candidatus Saccharimonadales bacterium]|nr:HEAT repeat domain-containing protein [Candidatus Saccharimonadales bacterium]